MAIKYIYMTVGQFIKSVYYANKLEKRFGTPFEKYSTNRPLNLN